MSVISGMDVYIAQNVSSMGADGYRVQRIAMMQFRSQEVPRNAAPQPAVDQEEYAFLRSRLALTREIGMSAGRGVSVHLGKDLWRMCSCRAPLQYGVITNIDAEEGRFLSDTENDRRMNAVFIVMTSKTSSSPTPVPSADHLRRGLPFQVVGVAKAKGSVFGQSRTNSWSFPSTSDRQADRDTADRVNR